MLFFGPCLITKRRNVDHNITEMTFFQDWELWVKMVFVSLNPGATFVLTSLSRLTECAEQVLGCLIVSEPMLVACGTPRKT